MKFMVKRLNENAIIPTRATAISAGYDLYATEDVSIKKGEKPILVHTGIAIEVESEQPVSIEVYIRSSIGRRGLTLGNSVGLIDQDYRGEILIMLENVCGDEIEEIHKGDRIAQLVIRPVLLPSVEEVTELSDTTRGAGGFGSTGK